MITVSSLLFLSKIEYFIINSYISCYKLIFSHMQVCNCSYMTLHFVHLNDFIEKKPSIFATRPSSVCGEAWGQLSPAALATSK